MSKSSSVQQEVIMKATVERRVSPRIPVQCRVSFYYLPPSLNSPVSQVINLSEGGACVEVPDPLIPGASIAFLIITSDHQVVDVRARVAYLEPSKNPPYRVGVCFTRLSANDRVSLAREIQRSASKNPTLRGENGSHPSPSNAED
jgi:hypothetical protein